MEYRREDIEWTLKQPVAMDEIRCKAEAASAESVLQTFNRLDVHPFLLKDEYVLMLAMLRTLLQHHDYLAHQLESHHAK